MNDQKDKNTSAEQERRTETRHLTEEYSSVEFSVSENAILYQFRIWETSVSGMSILVRGDSDVLDFLNVGDRLDMKYYPAESNRNPVIVTTEIRHITGDVEDRIKGHVLVGLSVSQV